MTARVSEQLLLDHNFLANSILIPAIKICAARGELSNDEEKILLLAARKQVISAADVAEALPSLSYQTVLRRMKKLRDRGLLDKSIHVARSYRLQFTDNALMRSTVSQLKAQGFLSSQGDV